MAQRVKGLSLRRKIADVIDLRKIGEGLLRPGPRTEFVTFWHGPLDPITYACLASFPFHGVRLQLYSYDLNLRVPAGVEVVDARRIIRDEGLIERYIVNGSTSFSKFSNLFRYRLLDKTGGCWVDGDVLCMKRPDFSTSEFVFGHQFSNDGPWALNGAVLKLPRKHPMLMELTERATDAVDIDSKWGVIGPLLVTEMAVKHDVFHHARPQHEFYPVRFRNFWHVLLPGYKARLDQATQDSTFLHLWNECYRQCNYDKTIAPPEGSFLHTQFARLGMLDEFRKTYSRTEMRTLLGDLLNQ